MKRLLVLRATLVSCSLLVCAILALGFAGAVFAAVPLIASFPAGDATAGIPAPGTDLIRFELSGPDVVCNDGTTPVMYLRRWTNQDDMSKWLIYLEGGGDCLDGDDCRDRWRSTGAQPNYGLQKMSTSVEVPVWNATHAGPPHGWIMQGNFYRVPTGIQGSGILSPNAGINPFAGWNIVFAYYCDGSSWSGQVTGQVLTTTGGQQYRIHFRGATIFDAIIAQLRSGATVYQYQGQEHAMPDLDLADMVLLSGSSAGGNGVKNNLDRLRNLLQAAHPEVEVRGVIDAAGSPTREFLQWNGAFPQNSYSNHMQDLWGQYTTVWNHRGDESCLVLNPADPWRCADSTHVLRHHITTPFFHRMDLQDDNAIASFQLHYPVATYQYEFAVHTSAQLHEIAGLLGLLAPRYPAEEAAMHADPQWLPPGVYGPRCTDHVGLTRDYPFFQQRVPDALGTTLTQYKGALSKWVNIVPVPGLVVPSPELVTVSGVGALGPPQCP